MEIFLHYVLMACNNDWVPGTVSMKSSTGKLFPDATWVTVNSVIGICQETNCVAPTAFIPIANYKGNMVVIALDRQVSRLVEFSTELLHLYSTVR